MDKLRALTVFRRIVELGSFQAAAKDLRLSKAAVTKNINELEMALETPLINRTTRKLYVTEAGQDYYREVCFALDAINNAEQNLFATKDGISGKLKVGAPISLGIKLINRLIVDFSDLYPKISIEILMDDKHQDLISQGVDIAIRGGGTLTDSSLKSRRVSELKRTLCASPNYLNSSSPVLAPEDLKSHECLGYSLSSSTQWRFSRGNDVEIIDPSPSRFTVNNSLALVEIASHGKGIILTPDIYVREKIQKGDLVALLPDWRPEPHYLYAVYPSNRANANLVRYFIDFLVERLI